MRNSILSITAIALALFTYPFIIGLQSKILQENGPKYKLYPEVNDERPDIPSPYTDVLERELVTAVTKEHKYAVMEVKPGNNRGICQQLIVDTIDFPELAHTGLHDEKRLMNLSTITGRSIKEITRLGLPGQLSSGGFMASDENIISVLKGDNAIVSKMGLTHPQLAKPLFHVLNMMDHDLKLNRWTMTIHEWENISQFYYHKQVVNVVAYDTKGGQLSIFDDDLQGVFHIKLWRELSASELNFLKDRYDHLNREELEELINKLSFINTGELEPQYIMRYGFYEGHTFWRTDPIAIAFIFGLKSLEEIEEAFPGNLYSTLTDHFTDSPIAK
ncbi:MAG: hypothetical protein DWQ02_06520 [Bacteroidetes bacterium]|nr:MAG: hypothetical protein DWQ02_06520 [Bacteroidota bacterium]